MTTVAAVILVDARTEQMRFLGLNLVERAALTAAKAGITRIHIVGDGVPDGDILRRLRNRGLFVTFAEMRNGVFAAAPKSDRLIMMPTHIIMEPRVVKLWLERAEANPAGLFTARLAIDSDVAQLEREYLTHVNGGDKEGCFTRVIRQFSVPLSRQLVRLPITANHVTLAGFGMVLLAAWAMTFATYWSGITGALLYYASMILDCSDGEVARAKLADSKFGAWLETVTDYLSYLAIIGGILWGDWLVEGFDHHTRAAIMAAPATLAIIAMVGYQRAKVAGANPGAFDDALAAQLGQGNGMQRFSVRARQLIKRSFLAHLILLQAALGFLPALLEIWAMGAVGALVVVLAVHSHLVNSVRVEPLPAA